MYTKGEYIIVHGLNEPVLLELSVTHGNCGLIAWMNGIKEEKLVCNSDLFRILGVSFYARYRSSSAQRVYILRFRSICSKYLYLYWQYKTV